MFISSKAAKINAKAPIELLLGLGGAKFARGYVSDTLVGGRLLATSFEVRYNKLMMNNKILKTIQPYVFYDYGYTGKKSSDTNISTLSSYGSGVRTQFNYDIKFNVEVAVPLKTSYMVTGTNYVASPIALFYISKSFKY